MRYYEIKLLEQQLDELSMKPSTLQSFLDSPEADGITMGIEFEMVVPGVKDSDRLELDYSHDTRPYSISEIIDFFLDGDTSSLTTNEAEKLRDELFNDYIEWVSDGVESYKNNNGEQWDNYVRESLEDYLNLDEFEDEARELLGDLFDPGNDLVKMQLILRDRKINSILDEGVEQNYPDAINDANIKLQDEFMNSADGDELSWLTDNGIHSMIDAMDKWNLDWGHVAISTGEELEEFSEQFASDMNVEVRASSEYHGNKGPDRFNTWNIEPDGSIDAESGESGLEFISPVLSLKDGINTIKDMFTWANTAGCYTNRSTGMHINISVPNYNPDNVDYIKLALFSGDLYVLEQFGRQYNNYTKSALKLITDKLSNRETNDSDNTAVKLINQMKQHLNIAASKEVIKRNSDRQTSINVKDGWVEFRSPGGNYLSEDPSKLTNTALRLAMALKISMDPAAHKQEYAKKLYKLASKNLKNNDNSVDIFTQYLAAQITKDQLITYLKTKQTTRKLNKIPKGELQHWLVSRSSQGHIISDVVATNATEAIRIAQTDRPEWLRLNDTAFSVQQSGMLATPEEKEKYTKDNAPLEGNNLYKVTNKLTGGESLLTGNSERDVINLVTQKFGTSSDDYTIELVSTGVK